MEPNLESLAVAASFYLHEEQEEAAGWSDLTAVCQPTLGTSLDTTRCTWSPNEALIVLLTCAGTSFELELLLSLRVFLLLHSRPY